MIPGFSSVPTRGPRVGRLTLLLLAASVAVGAGSARADIGAIMNVGAAFVGVDDINQIADELNFSSLSPGVDGGVQLRFGNLERAWSGLAGIDVFWSRRRRPANLASSTPFLDEPQSFQVTALGIPIGALYSIPRGGGRFHLSASVGYYVATVRAQSDLSGSGWFAGSAGEGERSADGPGFIALFGYERPTPIGALGGGIRFRRAKFPVDALRGAADFDVDLTGVSIFLSLSIRQQAPPE